MSLAIFGCVINTSPLSTHHPKTDIQTKVFPELGYLIKKNAGDTLLFHEITVTRQSFKKINPVATSNQEGLSNNPILRPISENDRFVLYKESKSFDSGLCFDKKENSWLRLNNIIENSCNFDALPGKQGEYLDSSTFEPAIYFFTDLSSPRQELIFLEKTKNTAKFLYRIVYNVETDVGINQEFVHDLNEGTEIIKNGARLDIINISADAIRFRVSSYFDPIK